jgi:uncharacterized membrane protein
MIFLALGVLIFFASHSVRIFADGWRTSRIAALGERSWKGAYALISLLGLALMVWGYGETRAAPALWYPPGWTRYMAALMTLPAFVLLVAAYVPGTRIKAVVGHPMVMGVMLWALAHLMSNGRVGDLLLFGAFLVWAFVDYMSLRHRGRLSGIHYATGQLARDAVAAVVGVALWALFVM